jgi:hypothetical protein
MNEQESSTILIRPTWYFRADGNANEYTIMADGNWLMAAKLNGEIHTPEQIKIMRMIAAAPDLLEALQGMVKEFGQGELDPEISTHKPILAARAAIAKATKPQDTNESLCEEYAEWCAAHELPLYSADDLIHNELLTDCQRAYLREFIERWNIVDQKEWDARQGEQK